MEKKRNRNIKIKKNEIAISLYLEHLKDKAILGYVTYTQKETFQNLLGKINHVLKKFSLQPVVDFHYTTEDGDVTYVNATSSDFTDGSFTENMNATLPSERRIYVYYYY